MVDTDERQAFSALAEQTGWAHRSSERNDYFAKGSVRVHVVWQDDSVVNGGTLYHDDLLTSYTRELPTVQSWLRR
ncbi:hypothetical protein EUA04_15940 [Mycolicibacterium obuense]|uniref:Uncharacterized protein n=1 Tax=Mycolicibacterium obuense TaxID=1807 RepID=A0A0J6W9U4_9MYCO|nr:MULTISPECIES: hypothetical protein [Mycobacteriaceae]KMO79960.1 hypothetical protein MOBUDSM44075_01093 [Mycolicibacterium obuense]OKH64576.1 hypothetical protein EB72_08805 [Mycobacterium sp. SWH-M1]TDL07411.1 hypothetical protein EUA04_15940 [Mycolicibacterium obuense]